MVLHQSPLTTRFPCTYIYYFPTHFHHYSFQPPLPAINSVGISTVYASLDSSSSSSKPLHGAAHPKDLLSLHNRSYDFAPLLSFISKTGTSPPDSLLDSSSGLGARIELDPVEFQLAESYRAVPGPLWHAWLKSLCSSSDSVGLAYNVVCWLEKHKLCFSYELLYSILIHALGRSEKLYEAFLLAQRQKLTPLTYNALIGACARNGEFEKALNLMSKMRHDGYPSDFVNYSTIIQALTRSNNIDTPLLHKLYTEIEGDKIELDSKLYNDIIVGYAKAGDPSRALHFLAMAQSYGLSPKSSTLIAIMSALGSSGRTAEAEAVFEEIKDMGLQPRTRAYNALLKAYVRAGSLKDAESIVSEMERSGVAPDELTYSLLMDAYGQEGRWESARIVLKEMEASNVQPSAYVFSRILASYRDKGEWQKSFQVLREMKSCGVRPDRHFYNVMIDTFGKYNCLEHAMDTFEKMLSEGIKPDNVTWNTLIDCHCKSGKHDRGEQLFYEMQDKGFAPCIATYNIMIHSLGVQERWEEMKRLFTKLKSLGLLPNAVTYTTLVDVYGMSGRFDDAMECLEIMKSGGLKPTSTMYNALINAYAQKVFSIL